jgi:uncharacterized membrane protein YdbT with pleckstrin-like domain
VVIDVRPHWSSVLRPALALVGSLALALMVQMQISSDEGYKDFVLIPALALVLGVLVWFLVRYARWATSSLVVTTHRVIVRSGVLGRRGREIGLDRVSDVFMHRPLAGRLVGAGVLTVESAEGGREEFPHCPRIKDICREVGRLVEASRAGEAQRDTEGAGGSPLVQLEKLDDLRRRGVISDAEFEAKKAQLLDRL